MELVLVGGVVLQVGPGDTGGKGAVGAAAATESGWRLRQ